MTKPSTRGLSFRTKLVLSFVLLSLGLVASALALSVRAAQDAAREKIVNDFRRTENAFRRLIEARINAFSESTAASLSDALFRSQISRSGPSDQALGLGDDTPDAASDTLEEIHGIFASADLPLFHRYPLVAITDSSGRLIFSRAHPQHFGESLKGLALVAHALDGNQAATLVDGANAAFSLIAPKANEAYLVLARPIVTAQGTVGAVVAGEPLSRLLDEAASIAQATVILDAPGVHAYSGYLSDIGKLDDLTGLTELPAHGERVLAMVIAVSGLGEEPLGRAVLVRSLSAEIGPFTERLRSAAGVVILLALLVSMGAAFLLSGVMTTSLKALEAAAVRVRQGSLDVHVNVKSRDEIGHLADVFNDMIVGLRQRDQIKATFKRYLAPAVVEELIRHPDRLNLGGEKRELSVLFSDLVGFTSLSEGRDAQALVSLLNEYFDEVGQAIVARGGTLDKFAGDSVMCFFGAPIEQPDHRARALLAGIDHLRVVDSVRERWVAQGRPPIDCRIGINTGEVVVGNIGSKDGQDYTVIGDAVNLASRLEGANKEYHCRFMVSEETLRGCEALVVVRELDWLRVKGKANAVRVFEVLGEAHRAPRELVALSAHFAAALERYRARDFGAAERLFNECLALQPKDGPSLTFMARCHTYKQAPPPEDWDGAFGMTVK